MAKISKKNQKEIERKERLRIENLVRQIDKLNDRIERGDVLAQKEKRDLVQNNGDAIIALRENYLQQQQKQESPHSSWIGFEQFRRWFEFKK